MQKGSLSSIPYPVHQPKVRLGGNVGNFGVASALLSGLRFSCIRCGEVNMGFGNDRVPDMRAKTVLTALTVAATMFASSDLPRDFSSTVD